MTGSRLPGLASVVVSHLVTLALVLQGALALYDLIVCYSVETALLSLLLPGDHRWSALRMRGSFSLVSLALGAGAITANSWDASSVAAVLATVVLTVTALVVQVRRRERVATLPSVGWRMVVLLVGGVAAVAFATDLVRLRAAGWQGTALGEAPADPVGLLVVHAVEGVQLPALSAAAIMLLGFKLVNEAGYELFDILRDRHVESRLRSPSPVARG